MDMLPCPCFFPAHKIASYITRSAGFARELEVRVTLFLEEVTIPKCFRRIFAMDTGYFTILETLHTS